MVRNMGLLLAGTFVLGLGACTTALPPEKTEALGMAFNDELKTRYLQLAASRRESLDWDYFHFREKAEASLLGDVVQPDNVDDHEICLPWQPDVLAARERLVALMESGARFQEPGAAADAQVDFDCWLDELQAQSRSQASCAQVSQPSPSSQCKDRLMAGLDYIEGTVIDESAPYNIYFATGSTDIDPDGKDVLARVKRNAELLQPTRILVVGYTDRHGLANDNKKLAEQRAREVAKALIQEGVPAASITVDAWGETIGKPNLDENRRVEITFES
ncbi:MAG: OmpA family protein [Geminicoccaceae bacterium]